MRTFYWAITALVYALSIPAHATVINFDELAFASDNFDLTVYNGYIHSGGFTIDNPPNGPLGVWGSNNAYSMDFFGGAAIFNNTRGGTTYIQKLGGAPFDFYSIDLEDFMNEPAGGDILFTFYDAMGGASTQTVSLDTHQIFGQTFVFDRKNVSYFAMEGLTTRGQTFQFDNLVVNNGGIINSGVPEPATWASMLAGFALMGAALRHKARQRVLVRYG